VVLYGLSGAVLLNTVFLCVLGGGGLFTAPVLMVLLAAVGVVGWRRGRPFVEQRVSSTSLPTGFWAFLVIAWCGPVLMQLASPVAPFRDVLPNHVAPVEFVRTYHWFPSLLTSPSPEYGPSRQLLGFLGLASTTTKLTGLPAVLAVAALTLPFTALLALATYRFAEQRLGPGRGMWALAVAPLSFVFLRLPDSRGTDLAIVLALISFLPLPELTDRGRVVVRASTLAATFYVHPLLGTLTLGAHGLLALWVASRESDEERDFPVGALLAAVALAFPEVLVVAGVAAPSWIVIFAPPLGLLTVFVCAELKLPMRHLGVALIVAGALFFAYSATTTAPRVVSAIGDEANLYPLMTLGLAAFVLTERSPGVRPYLIVPIAVGVLAHVAADFFPTTTIFWTGNRDEITGKTFQYWIPTFLALATAGALHWSWDSRRKTVGTAVVAAFLVAAVLPLRAGTVDIEDNRERRVAESLSIDMHKAEVGAWPSWPDARRVINASQRATVRVFRREQAAGRMTRHTMTLHIAQSRWSWVSTPVAAFAGVYETNFSEAPDITGHTLGGRLKQYADLPRYLGPRYPYVLLEPAGVPAYLRDQVVAAGYETIFTNEHGEIFRLGR
jgi:hypothetical protein